MIPKLNGGNPLVPSPTKPVRTISYRERSNLAASARLLNIRANSKYSSGERELKKRFGRTLVDSFPSGCVNFLFNNVLMQLGNK